jgi:Methane/Phenol/Toluene Hydroxylase
MTMAMVYHWGMERQRITLSDPARFRDPANLTWERYIALQARERERYLAEKAIIPADALAYRTVNPAYLRRAVDQFANNYYSELSATHYIATAAANAPFDELKKCCLFQLADEQRHLEMDREVWERAGIPEGDWLPAWEAPGTTCRFFRHVLELEDTVEIIVKANFVAEGAAGPGTFTVLADGAEERGDLLSAVNHRARIRDETRHISFARALVKALIEDDPSNLAVIQAWQDESLQLFAEVARGGQRREWWDGFLASYYKIALPLGLSASPVSV